MNTTEITPQQCKEGLDQAVDILKEHLTTLTEKFPSPTCVDNFYIPGENVEWTTGFRTGSYWLAYELTGDPAFRRAALVQVDNFMERITKRIDVDHHDMGFLYSPSCVAAYRITQSETGRTAALMAADNLLLRFHEKGQFFQAWGALGAPDNYRLIVDCLLNLPLLYWATKETGNPLYREKALAHNNTSIAYLVRDDYSTYHTYFFDPATGEPVKGVTAQGYRDGSAWARGQAWAIYGLALSYGETPDYNTISLFEQVTDFFINHLPEDGVPYWDLDFTDGDGEPKDSSAGAIAACGMLEMAPYLPEEKSKYYIKTAKQLAYALYQGYAVRNPSVSSGLLLHGVYGKSSPYNTVKNNGVDECNSWGDYFYLELLVRLSTTVKPYW